MIICDQAYVDLLGRDRSEILGSHVLDLTYAPDRARNAILLTRLADDGSAFSITKRYVRGDGSPVWVANRVSSFRDGAGPRRVCATSMVVDAPGEPGALVRHAAAARQLCAALIAGKAAFGPALVSAPAVEMMLALYLAELEGRCPTGEELAAGAELGFATALRWLGLLRARGLVDVEHGDAASLAATYRIGRQCELALQGVIAFAEAERLQ